MISFAVSEADLAAIELVADRTQALEAEYRYPRQRRKRQSIMMDLCAVQNSSTPLDLDRLLAADDFNFAHDVFGIERHLDRSEASPTGGELLDCFLPRCARKED